MTVHTWALIKSARLASGGLARRARRSCHRSSGRWPKH